jgi:hypothetical protein
MPINSFLYPGAKVVTGYEVANSLRFDDGSGDNLSTSSLGTPTSAKTYTLSWWVKRANIGEVTYQFGWYDGSRTNSGDIVFDAGDTLSFYHGSNDGNGKLLKPNRLFRDPSAWTHVVWSVDTTQSTASNRIKIYFNGVQETSFASSTYPAQNAESKIFHDTNNRIGSQWNGTSSTAHNGYMAEIVFIDGQQLDPTSFGEFDEDSGIWKPIDVSGLTFGNNGFHLDFEDSSALGNDVSGNDNDFTVNNLTSIDQTTDTCTNNFATINPLVRNKSYNDGSLAQGNTYFAPNGRAISCSTFGVTKGKWYAEFKAQDSGALYIGCGQLRGIDALSDGGLTNPIWYDNNPGYAVGYGSGGALEDGTPSTSYGSGYSDNDIVGVALDMDNYEMYISVNGTFQNSGDPTSGASKTGGVTGAISYNPFDDGFPIFFFVSDFSAAGVGECFHNYGNPAFSISSGNSDANGYGNFEYSVPSGYYSLNSKNLSEYG